MRTARLKMRGDGCYYHLMNRVAGTREDRPFGDVEKEYLVRLIRQLSRLYTLEIIGYTVMSNHLHIILWAPGEAPTLEETSRRYQAFYNGKRDLHPASPRCAEIAAKLHDISWFMRDLQQRFSVWYNRTRPVRRRGTLWADRFKSVILEGETALWTALKYIELNPVRAHIVTAPADYRHSSWGAWHGSGRHPYATNLHRHLKRTLGPRAKSLTLKQLQDELRADMARTLAGETATPGSDDVHTATQTARKRPPLTLRLDRRLRWWSDGLVIGSKHFVRQIATTRTTPAHAQNKRLGQAQLPTGTPLYSWRHLQDAQE